MPARSVLLIGPDPDARADVANVLTAAGHQVTEVAAQTDALQQAADHELIVVDATGGADIAAAFCRTVRGHPTLAAKPLLVIAEGDDIEERVVLFEAGANEVVPRPFDPRELENRMVTLELRLDRTDGSVSTTPPEQVVLDHRLIACFGAKGGTGTTTIAVNIALALAHRHPDSVAIIDLDTQFGQVHTHLDVNPKRTVAQLAEDEQALGDAEFMRAHATRVEPGLDVYAAPSSPAHAELVTADAAGRLLRTARQAYRVVVVDAGSHLDDVSLSVFEAADSIILTVRPEMAALRAVLSLSDYLREIGVLGPRVLYVTNHLFAREMVRLGAIEDVLGARVAVQIPHDPFIFLKAVNEGVPVVRAAPKSTAAQRMARLAAIAANETGRPEGREDGRATRRILPGLRIGR